MQKKDRLLLMIAVSGELPAALAEKVVGSETYARAVLTKLKKERMIAKKSRDGISGYVLRTKGKKYVLERYGADTAFYLSGDVQTNRMRGGQQNRLRLHRMGETWVFLDGMRVRIFQSQKPQLGRAFERDSKEPVFYGSMELKREADFFRASRACGVLLAGERSLVVYNTMAQRMKWAKKTEYALRSWAEGMSWRQGWDRQADALILARGMAVLPELLESDGGIRQGLFRVDDTFENYFFVPMCLEAETQMALLTGRGQTGRLRSLLAGIAAESAKSRYSVCDGYDREGNAVYFCYDLEMHRLLRIRQELAHRPSGKVICLDYQAEALAEFFGKGVGLQMLNTERVMEYLAAERE